MFRKNIAGAITAAAALAAGGAMAQTANSLPGNGKTYGAFSASEVSSLLAEYDIATEMRASNQPGRSPALVATLSTGAKFLVGFFSCADGAAANGCTQVMISTAQPVGGVEFDDLNNFNGVSNVTTAVYEPNNQILLFGRNIFTQGGVTGENLKMNVALFLKDMQTFVNTRQTGAASISFNKAPQMRSKITSITADGAASSAKHLLVSQDASLEVEIAINNSVDKAYDINVAAE